DVHAEGDRPLEKPGELLLVQSSQIHIVELAAEPFIAGAAVVAILGEVSLQILPHLHGGQDTPLSPVQVGEQRPLMPEEQAADLICGRLYIKDNTHALLLPDDAVC